MRSIILFFMALIVMLHSHPATALDLCSCDTGMNGDCVDSLCTLYNDSWTTSNEYNVPITCYDTNPPETMYIHVQVSDCSYIFIACPSPKEDASDVTVMVSGISGLNWNGNSCDDWAWQGGSFDLCDYWNCADFDV